ncbi:MAG TPA: hypothetical protein IAD47_05890 [Candidatus Limihabitans stercoravium]|nr:hypothetical protein [Candidatus Limihabitans stercoravium]
MSKIAQRAEKILLRDKYDNDVYLDFLKGEITSFLHQYIVDDGGVVFNADTSDGLTIGISVKVKKILPMRFN